MFRNRHIFLRDPPHTTTSQWSKTWVWRNMDMLVMPRTAGRLKKKYLSQGQPVQKLRPYFQNNKNKKGQRHGSSGKASD
jgi:hypothetical protein